LFYLNAAAAAPTPAGWYESSLTYDEDTNAADWPGPGAGFLIYHTGSTSNWVSTFEVQ